MAEEESHVLDGTKCTCGDWEAELGTSIWRGFDRHLIAVRVAAEMADPAPILHPKDAADLAAFDEGPRTPPRGGAW